jgi:phage terminase small subunit
MEHARPSFFSRLLRALRNVVVFSIIVGLVAAVGYQTSIANSRTFSLENQNGSLVVMKGKLAPRGFAPYMPVEPRQILAYSPLPLNGNSFELTGKTFEDRDALDAALFSVLETLAAPRLNSDVAKEIEAGLALVARAEGLDRLNENQRLTLKNLKSGAAFFVSKQRLEESRKQLEEALTQLKLAADSDNRHKNEAQMLLLAVEPQVKLLTQALRTTSLDKEDLAKALAGQLKANIDAVTKTIETPSVPKSDAVKPEEAKADSGR